MRMRIKQVKAWWVRIPIETARQHRSDFGQVRTFDAAILRIETDDVSLKHLEVREETVAAGAPAAHVFAPGW